MISLDLWFEWFNSLPPELAVTIIGTLPLAEARVAVPVGITYFGMHPALAVMYAAMGDLIPTIILINLLGPVSGFLIRRSKTFERFFHWLFEHTRHKFVGKYEKYGLLALTLFVAIPIPGSGSWAGSVASFVFGIPKRKAIFFVAIGVVIAASLIALITTGIVSYLDWMA
jgi:uncharacterized membrane protein